MLMRDERPGIPYWREEIESGLPRGVVQSLAETIAEETQSLASGNETVAHLVRLLETVGGRVHASKTLDWDKEIVVHGLSSGGRADFDVTLDVGVVETRQRWALAHVLAHYVLHSRNGDIPISVSRRGASVRAEWEANWFAAAFLVPEKALVIEYERTKSVIETARRFNVSFGVVGIRLEQLAVPRVPEYLGGYVLERAF